MHGCTLSSWSFVLPLSSFCTLVSFVGIITASPTPAALVHLISVRLAGLWFWATSSRLIAAHVLVLMAAVLMVMISSAFLNSWYTVLAASVNSSLLGLCTLWDGSLLCCRSCHWLTRSVAFSSLGILLGCLLSDNSLFLQVLSLACSIIQVDLALVFLVEPSIRFWKLLSSFLNLINFE